SSAWRRLACLLTPIATLACAYWLLSAATSCFCRSTRVAACAEAAASASASGVTTRTASGCLLEWVTIGFSRMVGYVDRRNGDLSRRVSNCTGTDSPGPRPAPARCFSPGPDPPATTAPRPLAGPLAASSDVDG